MTQIQMMQQTIRSEDYYTLHHIVEEADRKHLKQSRINKHPFGSHLNILRVLSSFKELFPSTPQRIYKMLMMITKNHNPQTKDQWIKAIEKLESIEVKQFRSSHSFLEQESQVHTRSHSQIHKLKSSNYQNSTKTYKQQLDHEIDSVVSKRSRAKFVGDFRITEPSFEYRDENKENNMQQSNRNSLRNSHHHAHYISFQPYQKDYMKQTSQLLPNYLSSGVEFNIKQNYSMPKKINPYHEITRIDNLSRIEDHQPSSKDDSKTLYSHNYRTEQNSYRCIPSRIQRNYSQAQVIDLDSKDSEISIKKSHLVRNQKFQDISEYEFYNMTIDQWESLNQKANTLYSFNLKLKAFSALLANYQAFQHDKFLKNKAQIFNFSYLQSKVFIALKANISIQQSIKQKLIRAQQFYAQNLYRKVWRVLQVMKNLKIEKSKKHFQISKLNRINYQFFMGLMFAEKSNFQNSPNKTLFQSCQESFKFEDKIQYFSRTQNFENVWDIYKCFGLNINISKKKFGEFFNNYHHSLLKQSFQVFKNYHQNRRSKYLKLHEKRLTEKVFSILLSRKQVAQNLKEKLLKASDHANKKLKQKTYKILLSIVYSTKIFSKRQQYIQSQKINRTKMSVLEKWICSYQNNVEHRKLQENKLEKMYEIVKQCILKNSFEKIREESSMIEKKIIEIKIFLRNSIKQRFFTKFKKFLKDKKKYFELCEKSSKNLQKNMLKKWFRLVKLKFSLTKMQQNYKKFIFRNLFVPITHQIKQDYLLNLQAQKKLVKLCFQHWKYEKTLNEERINSLKHQLSCYFANKNSKSFLDVLKINKMENILLRKRSEINQKVKILQNQLFQLKNQFFVQKLKANALKQSLNKDCMKRLSVCIKKNVLNKILSATEYQSLLEENSSKLKSHTKSQNFKYFCFQLHRNKLQGKQKRLQLKSQKKTFSNFLVQVSQKYRKLKDLGQKSENHYKSNMQRKVLLTLANILIDRTQRSHELTETLSNQRKQKYFSIFKQHCIQLTQIKARAKLINQRQLFVGLRENRNLKNRKKQLESRLIIKKISQTFQIFKQNMLVISQTNTTEELANKLKKKLFWVRFNQYFIDSLFQKKHIFMAYKFRALKLYGIAFRQWKKSTLQTRQDSKNRSKLSKQLQKQKFFNHRQKQVKNMYRQTDCSIISK